ncbi:fatty acid desaturase 6 isoform X1 [Pezoporus wallicus]|uniref:fatty acid desaturase 6 isoform X1 n=1 Tax=Pezoporus wallicus TaxID=35540 RepID=UPI002550E02E|nr:fatty acid desaturase 6 isoform X1 [Pezoporus wallicus]XP_061311486.1 fatty acid desaturase 6 isoform X1 [Pezoporus flaviventris]
MPLEDGDAARQRGQWVNGKVSGTPWLGETEDPLLQDTTAPDGSRTEPTLGDKNVAPKGALQQAGQREEALMTELSELVQKVVKSSSWWERHGVDISILGCSFLLLPAAGFSTGFLCLRSAQAIPFLAGVLTLGVVHHTLTVKGSHLASHNALTESKSWGKVWAIFFIELCSAFTVEQATYNHVKIHHGYTNVIGLGDSSTWKLPFLNRYVYMFIAPLAVPILTPLVALDLLRNVEWKAALRTLCCMFLGLYCHYWLLLHVSGFQSPWSALLCMLLTRSLLAHPYIHVNIFQHIGLPMFAADRKPKRIQLMSLGVLNLPRNALLDWSFGHSLISCHVEHHLFPSLSDNMCLKIKPIVSQYLKQKKLPYNEDTYTSRLRLFLQRYEELMVHAPPLTELVGIQ